MIVTEQNILGQLTASNNTFKNYHLTLPCLEKRILGYYSFKEVCYKTLYSLCLSGFEKMPSELKKVVVLDI